MLFRSAAVEDLLAHQQVFDSRGRLLMQIDPRATAGASYASNYNNATASVTSYAYDGLDRILSVQNDLGKTTAIAYSYDAAHNTIVTTTNPVGVATVKTLNPEGDLTSLVHKNASGTVLDATTYAYDANGWLRMSTDPTGLTTHYIWDSSGRQVGVISPSGELTETVYNDDGQVIRNIQYASPVSAALLASDGSPNWLTLAAVRGGTNQIGRASCRERV